MSLGIYYKNKDAEKLPVSNKLFGIVIKLKLKIFHLSKNIRTFTRHLNN